jgi:hypothetical protein
MMLKNTNYKKELNLIIVPILIILFSSFTYADLYLNSKEGFVNLNTTGQTRLQITPGGNLNLIGLVNVSIPGNLSIGGNVSVDGSTFFVDSEDNRVGIGTTNPGGILDINQNITAADVDVRAININTAASANGVRFLGAATGEDNTGDVFSRYIAKNSGASEQSWSFGIDTSDSIKFKISSASSLGSSDRLVIDTLGRVGIGTTSPRDALHIEGSPAHVTINRTGIGSNEFSLMGRREFADSDIGIISGYWNDTLIARIYFESGDDLVNHDDGRITFLTSESSSNPAERMRIEPDGSIGIGTSSPEKKLVLATGLSDGIELTNNSGNRRAGIFQDGTSATNLELYNSSGGLTVLIDTNSNSYLNGGNVGIGTAIPSLYANGGADSNILHLFTSHPSTPTGIRLEMDGDSTAYEIWGDGNSLHFDTMNSNRDFTFNSQSIEYLRIKQANGQVGIGTSDPQYLLQVANGTDGRDVNLSGALYVNGSSGNTGIGTSSMDEKLHVEGAGGPAIKIESTTSNGNASLELFENSNTGIEIQYDGSPTTGFGQLDIIDINAGTPTKLVSINRNGLVGIGTTNPDVLLHIRRTQSGGSAQINIENTNADAFGPVLRLDKNSSSPADGDTIGYLTYRGLDDGLGVNDYGNIIVTSDDVTAGSEDSSFDFWNFVAGTEKVVMTIEAGNVGIGTTNPDTKLDIEAADPRIVLHDTNTAKNFYLSNGVSSNNEFSIADDSIYALRIAGSGNVKMQYLGSNGGEDRYVCLEATTGNLTDKGSACSTSSIRYKENIRDSNYGLKEVMQLRQVMYNYKKEKDPDKDSNNIALKKDHIGLIAEEVLQVMPELIYFDQDGNVDNIRYEAMHSVLINAIQEQQGIIESLQSQINSLTN